jgi:hypothetical protein
LASADLVPHSWLKLFGLELARRYPDWHAYIGVGQVANISERTSRLAVRHGCCAAEGNTEQFASWNRLLLIRRETPSPIQDTNIERK